MESSFSALSRLAPPAHIPASASTWSESARASVGRSELRIKGGDDLEGTLHGGNTNVRTNEWEEARSPSPRRREDVFFTKKAHFRSHCQLCV